jgi:hypothetical protein
LLDNAQGLNVGFDAKVGELIERKALLIELAETRFIAEERTVRDVCAAREEFFNRAV